MQILVQSYHERSFIISKGEPRNHNLVFYGVVIISKSFFALILGTMSSAFTIGTHFQLVILLAKLMRECLHAVILLSRKQRNNSSHKLTIVSSTHRSHGAGRTPRHWSSSGHGTSHHTWMLRRESREKKNLRQGIIIMMIIIIDFLISSA